MINEYFVRKELDQVIDDIVKLNENPTMWLMWVKYFLQGLDQKSMDVNPINQQLYEDMLTILQDTIRNRMKTGGW